MGRSVRRTRFPPMPEEILHSGSVLPTSVAIHPTYTEYEGACNLIEDDENYHDDEDQRTTASTPKWLQYEIRQSQNLDQLARDINFGSARACSDGSFLSKEETGSAAWKIESHYSTQFIEGTSIAPGPGDMQSAYRSELLGKLALLHQILRLCETQCITTGKITMWSHRQPRHSLRTLFLTLFY